MSKFVISITSHQTGNTKFVGGSTEGSYFSLRHRVQDAKWFDSVEECTEALNHQEFTKRNEYDDVSMPPSLIWSGLEIRNDRRQASGIIEIVEILFRRKSVDVIEDKIIRK